MMGTGSMNFSRHYLKWTLGLKTTENMQHVTVSNYDFLSTTKLRMTAQNQARATVAIQIHRIVEKGEWYKGMMVA